MAQAQEVMDTERVFDLDLRDRGNLDEEMQTLVDGIVKKYGFMPNFLKLFATDNQRMRAFVTPYLELLRTDSGLNQLDHEMIALVSATTNGCSYCCAHHGALMRGESGDPMFAEHLSRNYKLADLSPRHLAMLDFVVKVLKDAEHIDHDDRQACGHEPSMPHLAPPPLPEPATRPPYTYSSARSTHLNSSNRTSCSIRR